MFSVIWALFKEECRAYQANAETIIDGWVEEEKQLQATRHQSGSKANDVTWAIADREALALLQGSG